MAKVFANSDALNDLKKDLRRKEDEILKRNTVPYEQWSELEKSNQRYVDNIRSSYAEYHEKHKRDE